MAVMLKNTVGRARRSGLPKLRNWVLDERLAIAELLGPEARLTFWPAGPPALAFYWRMRVTCGHTVSENTLAVWVFNQKREHDYANRNQHYSESSLVVLPSFLAEQPQDAKHNEEQRDQHFRDRHRSALRGAMPSLQRAVRIQRQTQRGLAAAHVSTIFQRQGPAMRLGDLSA